MAGGSPVPGINGGEYTPTTHKDAHGVNYTLKQGDLGSHVLHERPSGTVWKAGGLANGEADRMPLLRWLTESAHSTLLNSLLSFVFPSNSAPNRSFTTSISPSPATV